MALINIGVEQLVGAEAKMMVWYRTACRSGEMLRMPMIERGQTWREAYSSCGEDYYVLTYS